MAVQLKAKEDLAFLFVLKGKNKNHKSQKMEHDALKVNGLGFIYSFISRKNQRLHLS